MLLGPRLLLEMLGIPALHNDPMQVRQPDRAVVITLMYVAVPHQTSSGHGDEGVMVTAYHYLFSLP